MVDHAFLAHAILAGTLVALGSGLAGWFVVLRGEVFAADALGHVAFPGALAAVAVGIDARVGLVAATVAVGLGIARLGDGVHGRDLAIGAAFTWVLGIGSLLLGVLSRDPAGDGAALGARTLFGSIFGLSAAQATLTAGISGLCVLLLLAMARPLLLASLAPAVARARGVRVLALELAFLTVLAVLAAQAAQAVGALLLLGLVAAPAGAAHRLTTRPYLGMGLAAALSAASMWAGLALSYRVAELAPSAAVVLVAGLVYAGSRTLTRSWAR